MSAEKNAKEMMALVKTVSEQFYFSAFPSFVGWKFGINDQIESGRRFDHKANIDLSKWPTESQMGDILRTWHAALKALQTAWTQLEEADKVGFSQPPTRMDPRF
ncbi:MAG: hypothetical protein JWQ89_3120 [Devosia sp.]|nr:hypothetical protein [Devosia sp.]